MAYTKYSLTPANNTAAPPDGAPEGMLPSAVNDTMRDMMAQIRDCGDGIRDGTYTMTAPKITGGTITGSTINNSAIGGTTAAAGAFTTLSATGVTTVQAGTVSLPAITTTGDTNTGIYFPAADTIAFTEGGAESMRISSTGTVAIGTTTTPTAKLWVESGRVGLTNAYKLGWHSNPAHADLGNYITGDDSTNYIALGTSGTERMRIDSSGNVGIGTTSASSIITSSGYAGLVVGSGSGANGVNIYSGNNSYGAIAFGDASTGTGTYVGLIEYSHIDNWMRFWTNGSERMRITSGGDVGIGTTTPNSKLAVIGNVYVDSYLGVATTPASTAMVTVDAALNSRDGIRLSTNNSPASGSFISFRNLSGNVAGSITHTGTTTVAYNTSSDYRLKENIAPMTSALAKVTQLKPCTYTWKADGSDGQGFIAHELAEVCPQAVTFEKDAVDAEGNPKYQGVDTSFLVATLTAAIQELNAKVDAQAVRIAELESK